MEIAILKKKYDDSGGGAERYTAKVASALSIRGHEVSVLAETFRSSALCNINFIKIQRSNFKGFSRTANFHAMVQKTLKGHKFDLVYSVSRTYPTDIFRISEQIHAEWIRIAYKSWQRLNPRHFELLRLEKKIYSVKNTKALVTNSMLTKAQVIKNFGYPEEKIHFIRNGVDRQTFYPSSGPDEISEIRRSLQLPENKLILLFPAGNFKIKGFDSIIKTLLLLEPGLRANIFIAAVGGDLDRSGTSLLEKYGLEKNVRFEGRQSRMRDYYAASDLLFYPSLYEPFANVCLEACACGLPVLTTALNGSSELVTHGSGGYVVPSAGDTVKMAEHISEFFNMPMSGRAKFAETALMNSLPYDWDKHLDALEKLFSEIKGG